MPALARGAPTFASASKLLLKQRALPPHYHYRSVTTVDSVSDWDGGIQPVMALDLRNGWQQGAQELTRDPQGKDAMLSVQLFDTVQGARADFGLFFTNQHPETRFIPGAYWLGGRSVGGLGDMATLYRVSDESSHCPGHLTTGLSFAYGNAIFSVGVCTRTVGEHGARDLANRLLRQALALAGR
jgi:hypothetical protein